MAMSIMRDVGRIIANWFAYVRAKPGRYLDEMIQFASDASRGDPVVAARLGTMRQEHIAAPYRNQTRSISSFEFAVSDILFDAGWALLLDWKERADEVISAVDILLHRISGSGLDLERVRAMRATVAQVSGGDTLKTEIDLVYGPLCEELEQFDLRFLDINRGGDDYAFVIVTQTVYHRWVDTIFTEDFVVDDPGWQFAQALRGTRYERFAHERRLRRPEHATS